MARSGFLLSIGFTALVTACGGSTDGEETTSEAATSGSETSDGEAETSASSDGSWATMSQQERFAYMTDTVEPEMRAIFQEYDAEMFSEFGCATCHGADAQEVGYEMPNELMPLSPGDLPMLFASEQPMPQLMTQTVLPRMIELLGAQPFDQETGEGFACLSCHANADGG